MKYDHIASLLIVSTLLAGCGTSKLLKDSRPTPAQEQRRAQFKSMDTDGDGKLTFEQISKYHVELFKNSDQDHDRFLEVHELPSVLLTPAVTPNQLISRFDGNGDSKLSQGEFSIRANVLIQRDRNGDGVITIKEFLSSEPLGRKQGKKRGKSANGEKGNRGSRR